jgi:hypothetical protein
MASTRAAAAAQRPAPGGVEAGPGSAGHNGQLRRRGPADRVDRDGQGDRLQLPAATGQELAVAGGEGLVLGLAVHVQLGDDHGAVDRPPGPGHPPPGGLYRHLLEDQVGDVLGPDT